MTTKEKLKDLMLTRNLSQAQIARALGLSPATVNQYVNGKYEGDEAKIEKAVESFLETIKEKTGHKKYEMPFVDTKGSKTIFETARLCHLDSEIGIAYGNAGLGKTYAIKEYVRKNPAVILIEADLGYTTKIIISEIHKKLGFNGIGSIHSMFEDIVDKLKNSGRLIIIDEAEHLPYRALELLRRIYDKANIGILLAGMPRLVFNLRGKKGEFAQLYSRVGIAGKIEELGEKDTTEIVRKIIPDAKENICKTFFECSHGNARILSKLILRSLRVAEINKKHLNTEIIRETIKLLII